MSQEFRTGSIPLASFLISKSAVYLRCEVSGLRRCEFIFSDRENNLNELAKQYYGNEAVGNIRVFYNALLHLKQETTRTLRGGAR
jgi:hypothetical protein